MKALTFKQVNKLNKTAIYHLSPFVPMLCDYEDDRKSLLYGHFYVRVGFPTTKILISVCYDDVMGAYSISTGQGMPIECHTHVATFDEVFEIFQSLCEEASFKDYNPYCTK